MWIALDGRGALSEQVFRSLCQAILSGTLGAEARLPPSRSLAAELGVSRNTVVLAYEQLLAEGYVQARVGSGTYVATELPESARGLIGGATIGAAVPSGAAAPSTARPPAPRVSRYAARLVAIMDEARLVWTPRTRSVPYDFRYARPSYDDFPHEAWCRVLARRARRASVRALDYGSPAGALELREAVAAYMARSRGVTCDPEQIVVVNGSQQALDLCARVVLDPGDGVIVEEPGYPAARAVFAALGARVRPCPVDDAGIDVGARPFRRSARLAYVTPAHQFPTGATMPLARRLELLAWARRADAFVLEDDYDSEYRYRGRPVQALAGLDRDGRVLYAGTFSKLLFPALRLGFLVLPPPLVDPFRRAKGAADTGSPTLLQLALADFLVGGHFERHLRRSRLRHAALRRVMLESIAEHLGDAVEVAGADAGLHVLLWLRDGEPADVERLRRRAAELGVGIYPTTPFYAGGSPRAGIILGWASLGPRDIREGIRLLGTVLRARPT